ncbi:hypothetical protein BHM03_00043504 [Ensete ventricosum]|nr:hypothetical protein BHM03_00043504 [Ensete ventricosum]
MQRPPRSGWLGLSCHPDVQHVRACFRHAPRDRLDAADARDADLAGWGGFNKIYPRHVDPSVGVRLVHLVSLEYGYQLALARLRARHPRLEIKEDPFMLLPEDADVPMADEQPFDDSLLLPEE